MEQVKADNTTSGGTFQQTRLFLWDLKSPDIQRGFLSVIINNQVIDIDRRIKLFHSGAVHTEKDTYKDQGNDVKSLRARAASEPRNGYWKWFMCSWIRTRFYSLMVFEHIPSVIKWAVLQLCSGGVLVVSTFLNKAPFTWIDADWLSVFPKFTKSLWNSCQG